MPPRPKLYDHQGRALVLGPPLASGGEGVVHTVAKDLAVLAKVYHQPPDARKVDKLRWMVQDASPELCRFAAWPTATLHDTPGGPLVGFLMPRFEGFRPIHTLYSPAHRRTSFPDANWSFLIHAAVNCAGAFDAVHARGHVIGDVNQSNVLVSNKTLVALIDCDSFQVRANGQLFPCEVGVAQYTPSELQGQNFRNVVRSANHDRFGLAVLIFHLLFMGRHPFAGRFLGAGEMPLERSIKEFRFVYSEADPATRMAAPPYALPLRTFSSELARLFEKAFDRGAERDDARPTAADWHAALTAFESQLRPCPREPGHKVPAHLPECPWCGIIKAGGPNFFLGAGLVGVTFVLDRTIIAELWKRIEAVPQRKHTLGKAALPAGLHLVPARLSVFAWLGSRGRQCFEASLTFCFFGALAMGGWLGWWPYGVLLICATASLAAVSGWCDETYRTEKKRRKQALEAATARLKAAEAEWQQTDARYQSEFPRLTDELKKLKERFERLQAGFDAECPKPGSTLPDPEREALCRDQYLRTRFINEHKIPGIGSSRAVLLASYGIETAYDLTEKQLQTVRGIGPVLRENLLKWKQEISAGFKYDPQAVLPQEVPRALVFKYKQFEEGLRAQLHKGAVDLEALSSQTEEQLQAIAAQRDLALIQVAQANLDFKAVPW